MRCFAVLSILIVLTFTTAGLAQHGGPTECRLLVPEDTPDPLIVVIDPTPFVIHLDGYTLPACQAVVNLPPFAMDAITYYTLAMEQAVGKHGGTLEWFLIDDDEKVDVLPWYRGGPVNAYRFAVGDNARAIVVFTRRYENRLTGVSGALVTYHPY